MVIKKSVFSITKKEIEMTGKGLYYSILVRVLHTT